MDGLAITNSSDFNKSGANKTTQNPQNSQQKVALQKVAPPEKCQTLNPSNLPETLFTLNKILQSQDAEATCDIQKKDKLQNYTNLSFQSRTKNPIQWLSNAGLNESTVKALKVRIFQSIKKGLLKPGPISLLLYPINLLSNSFLCVFFLWRTQFEFRGP